MNIAIIGAFDRFNYGDMLFPYIIEYGLQSENTELAELNVKYFGLRESDYSFYGAVRTEPLKNFYKNRQLYSYVFIAGGDTIPATLSGLYMDNMNNEVQYYFNKILNKILSDKIFNMYMRLMTGINSKYPYNIVGENVIYNSVGGSYLSKMNIEHKNEIIHILKCSAYLSVRDSYTKNQIDSDSCNLVPDSAVILSDIWNEENNFNGISKSLTDKIDKLKNYIIIQLKVGYSKEELVSILNNIKEMVADNINIVLLPIGRIHSHGDVRSLIKIKKMANSNLVFYFDDLSLNEIAYVIKKSSYYIGTSLHGNITAFSYQIPSSLITNEGSKNWSYYKTWLNDSSCVLSSYEAIYDDCNKNISIESDLKIYEQKQIVYKHFEKIKEIMIK